jgi:hypothetical protein
VVVNVAQYGRPRGIAASTKSLRVPDDSITGLLLGQIDQYIQEQQKLRSDESQGNDNHQLIDTTNSNKFV